MKQLSFADSCEKTKAAFSFLISDYQFSLTIINELNYGFIVEYKKGEIRVHLYYDYRENAFYFYLVRGAETKIPNDNDSEDIKLFYELFKKHDAMLTFSSIQPTGEGYELALSQNAEMLKKYGHNVLNGLEWV